MQHKKGKTMNREDALKTVEEYKAFLGKAQEEFKEKGGELFKALLSPVFENFPEVNSISWTQYTPYFNDGDECTFGVRNDYPEVNGEEVDYKSKLLKDIVENLQAIDEDIYKFAFGDHVKVTIHRDGKVEIDEYSHD